LDRVQRLAIEEVSAGDDRRCARYSDVVEGFAEDDEIGALARLDGSVD
jgi:hypothetical protein